MWNVYLNVIINTGITLAVLYPVITIENASFSVVVVYYCIYVECLSK